MTAEWSFHRKMQIRRGALRVQRFAVGMSPVRNENEKAPTNRGWWAFPWPLVNWFYCGGKRDEIMPKQLRRHRWFPDSKRPQPEPADVLPLDEWEDRYRTWHRDVGRRVMKLHDGWWTGPIYSHLDPNGRADRIEFHRFDGVETWARSARRHSRRYGDEPPDPDFYELWLPAGPGHGKL